MHSSSSQLHLRYAKIRPELSSDLVDRSHFAHLTPLLSSLAVTSLDEPLLDLGPFCNVTEAILDSSL